MAEFLMDLERPLLTVDVERGERDRERLAALAAGNLPEAV